MKLQDLFDREPPEPWEPGSKLPWNEPAFSARMLREHLSQQHDRASRRLERIERQVEWIHREVLRGEPARVLDLGCGPGLYASRLAARGHPCLGIDFSPASIEYARSEAERQGLACEYRLRDLRDGDYGAGFQAALLVSGELNTFQPPEARAVLAAARRALVPGAPLVLELHTESFVQELGSQGATWYTSRGGLFSDEPHLCLRECTWHPEPRVAVERYFVIDAASSEVRVFTSTTQAYASSGYASLLEPSGFGQVERHPSLDGSASPEEGLLVLVARAQG